MIKFGKGVVKHRVLILIVAFALLIPSGISFINTRINFDIPFLSAKPDRDYEGPGYHGR